MTRLYAPRVNDQIDHWMVDPDFDADTDEMLTELTAMQPMDLQAYQEA